MAAVVRKKSDAEAKFAKTAHQVSEAHAAGILVGLRCIGVDNQHPAEQPVISCLSDQRCFGGIFDALRLVLQRAGPARQEFFPVDGLEPLGA